MRADFVALGIRLGWVGANDNEEPALAVVMERLRDEGKGILLIYDNAIEARALKPYLPRTGAARVLITSNAPDWGSVAIPVEIRVWPTNIGADFLVARTGCADERSGAKSLSEARGGLPLAHEQAAASGSAFRWPNTASASRPRPCAFLTISVTYLPSTMTG